MSGLTRDGTAEPISRDQTLRRERGRGNMHFPSLAGHEQDWQPCMYVCMYGHTYSKKSMDQPGTVASPARGQPNKEN